MIFAETEQERAVLGVVDGIKPQGIETEQDSARRTRLLRSIGCKF